MFRSRQDLFQYIVILKKYNVRDNLRRTQIGLILLCMRKTQFQIKMLRTGHRGQNNLLLTFLLNFLYGNLKMTIIKRLESTAHQISYINLITSKQIWGEINTICSKYHPQHHYCTKTQIGFVTNNLTISSKLRYFIANTFIALSISSCTNHARNCFINVHAYYR